MAQRESDRWEPLARPYPWIEVLLDLGDRFVVEEQRIEARINIWRLLIVCVLALIPLSNMVAYGPRSPHVAGLVAALLVAAVSFLFLYLIEFQRLLPAIRYASVTLDVTAVSVLLLSYMLQGDVLMATNSQVTFLVYFLVLALIASRYDEKLAIFGASLVVLEYLAVVAAGYLFFGLPEVRPDAVYGAFTWTSQVGRLIILCAASIIAVTAVRNARQLRESSIRDPLTGVYNRGYFQDVLKLEMAYSRRQGTPLSVVMMDIDRFKRFNDTYGHLKGDGLLVAVGDFLNRNLRRSDVLARYGGDEFVLLLLETEAPDACRTLLRLQTTMGDWLRELVPDASSLVTFSLGVASMRPGDETFTSLMERADSALYKAKQAGGNVVCGEDGETFGTEEIAPAPRQECTV